MAGLIESIVGAGAEAAVRASLKAYFDTQVKEGAIDATKAAYIEEGAADAVGFGLSKWFAGKK